MTETYFIYQVESKTDKEHPVYIGSTQLRLAKRLRTHTDNYTKYKSGTYNYVTIFDLFEKFGTDGCEIKLVQILKVNSKQEALVIEGQWIKNTKCVNQRIAGRTRKEWIQDNPEKRAATQKKYREKKMTASIINELQKPELDIKLKTTILKLIKIVGN